MSQKYSKVLLGTEARDVLLRGIEQVAIPVGKTIGAAGRNSTYRDYGEPIVTNDGISIARRINPQDKFERMGADMIKQASERTNSDAGDGTSGTIVLGHALVVEGLNEVNHTGKNAMEVKRELINAGKEAVEELKKMAVPVTTDEDILNIAKISVEDESVAKIVTDAVKKAGKNGAVIVEESAGYNIEKEEVQGYFWNQGYVSPYMATNERGEAILEDVPVIITDKYMNLNKDILGTINSLISTGVKSALIIADKVEGELLQSMIVNKLKGIFTIIAVKRPATIDELEDIAALVGGTAVTKDKGIKDIMLTHIGKAKKVIVKKDSTTIIGSDSDKLQSRILELEVELGKPENRTNDSIIERLAKLASGIVMLRVGAKTEAERKYLKLKVDDAVSACRAAMEEGIVEGAGVTLKKLAEKSTNPIFKKALIKPFEKILENAGIKNDGNIYNVLTQEKVTDLFKAGIIDPKKVVRNIIENAVSFASIFLTVESVIVDELEKEIISE